MTTTGIARGIQFCLKPFFLEALVDKSRPTLLMKGWRRDLLDLDSKIEDFFCE
jgi:hypothetical protein